MKDVVETILEHPIASIVVIAALFGGISDIIYAVKGKHRTYINIGAKRDSAES